MHNMTDTNVQLTVLGYSRYTCKMIFLGKYLVSSTTKVLLI